LKGYIEERRGGLHPLVALESGKELKVYFVDKNSIRIIINLESGKELKATL